MKSAAIDKLFSYFLANHITLATAESCTGGMLAAAITAWPVLDRAMPILAILLTIAGTSSISWLVAGSCRRRWRLTVSSSPSRGRA